MRKVGTTIALLLVLGGWLAIANRQTLYSLFPALKPAIADTIDVVTNYATSVERGPDFKVRHRVREVEAGCRHNPSGTQCLQYNYESLARAGARPEASGAAGGAQIKTGPSAYF